MRSPGFRSALSSPQETGIDIAIPGVQLRTHRADPVGHLFCQVATFADVPRQAAPRGARAPEPPDGLFLKICEQVLILSCPQAIGKSKPAEPASRARSPGVGQWFSRSARALANLSARVVPGRNRVTGDQGGGIRRRIYCPGMYY